MGQVFLVAFLALCRYFPEILPGGYGQDFLCRFISTQSKPETNIRNLGLNQIVAVDSADWPKFRVNTGMAQEKQHSKPAP